MTKIRWTGPERVVPTLGVLTTGDIREVQEHVAKSLIYQGLAVRAEQPKKEAKK